MSDTAPAENDRSSKEAPKYRHDWYQTASDVCVNVMVKGLKKEQVQVDFTETTVRYVVPSNNLPHTPSTIPLQSISPHLKNKLEKT